MSSAAKQNISKFYTRKMVYKECVFVIKNNKIINYYLSYAYLFIHRGGSVGFLGGGTYGQSNPLDHNSYDVEHTQGIAQENQGNPVLRRTQLQALGVLNPIH